MALVAFSGLPAGTTVATSDIMAADIGGTTKRVTAGQFRTSLFAFAATDPLNIGALTAVGNSTITGTLAGVTSFSMSGALTSAANTRALFGNMYLGQYGGAYGEVGFNTDGGNYVATDFASRIRFTSGGMDFQTAPSGTAGNPITFATVLSITQGGALKFLNAPGKIILAAGANFSFRNSTDTADTFLLTTSGDLVPAATLAFVQAASRIIAGATSLSLRNSANSADNLIVTDAGVATIRAGLTLTAGPLTFSQALQKIALPSGSSIDFRLAADAGSVLLVSDTGAVQVSNGQLTIAAATTARASLLMPSGTAPTSPTDGMMWYDGTNVKFRVGVTTKTFTLT